jgi:predicted enzyme related to lactoylglutathione lyase
MLTHGGQPGWLGVIGVADVDAAAKQVAEAGGTIHKQPDDIPTVGRYAVVADPGGAVFELLTPLPMENEPAPLAPTTPGKVSWHELYSSAGQEKAFAYYSGLFGWKTDTEMDMGAMGKYRIFSKDGVQLGGMMDKPENVPVSAWTYYINVDGIDAATERVKANGGQVLMGPMEVPGGSWIIQAKDPQGAHFALVSTSR